MGNTTASAHIAWKGGVEAAAKAIVRCYSKLGYARVKKAPPEGGKHVVLLARAGQSFVSIYDSNNAKLDAGELKELARAASKALKTAAVFTSLYDSDTFEFIVFSHGRQVDLLMTDDENYDGPMKRLDGKERAAKWSTIFSRPLSADLIGQAAESQTAFADSIVAGLSKLIGLDGGQPQINYQDFLDDGEKATTQLYFKKKPNTLPEIPAGEILLRDYFDADNCRMRSVYPAGWPISIGAKRLGTWLMISEGAGIRGGTVTFSLSGPDTFKLSRAVITGCKFHNGQIVGSLEPAPPNLTQEELNKLVDAKRFKLEPVESSPGGPAVYRGEFHHLISHTKTPEQTTQTLVILQVDLDPPAAGEWEINVTIQPGEQTEYRHSMPPLRIAAVERKWIPVISGLNPKTTFDKSNLSPTHLYELNFKQSRIPIERGLDHAAVTSSVAILKDEGQPTLDACKAWLEAWLRPLAEKQEGEIRINAQKQMTETAYVGKTKKNLPVFDFLGNKMWDKLFDDAGNYQTVLVGYVPKGAECPIAGIGLQHSFKEEGFRWKQENDKKIADTLAAMRGRPFEIAALEGTWHVFKWVVNHEDGYKFLQTSAAEMDQQLDSFAAAQRPLQAWRSQGTWIPLFDYAGRYERTAYEDSSLLNWFRGILNNGGGLEDVKMSAPWCSNVLRMVAPRMWLCQQLIAQVDRAALDRVAEVSDANGVYKITLRPDCTLEDLELALLPVLPAESVRISAA